MRIGIGADHAGWGDKERLVKLLESKGHEVVDFGTTSEEPVDYPDFAVKVARAVAEGRCDEGILVCGTGVGMSMAANKVPGIRAAAVQCVEAARFSRTHNDANVLCVGSRVSSPELIRQIVETWLGSVFEGGRHQQRVDKIKAMDKRGTC